MRVLQLHLINFRNYAQLDLDVPAQTTILWGNNAQGKSNLLEAIYYLATTRSFRAHSDRDLLSWDSADDPIAFTRIGAKIERAGKALDLDVVLRDELRQPDAETPALSKRIRLNEVPKRGLDVIGVATAVMFSPQDLDLVEGAPLLRRRYLDVTISLAERPYCRALAHYNRVVVQRNHLLRAMRDRGAAPDQLQFWNDELVESGAFVVAQRLATVQRLRDLAGARYGELSGTAECLTIDYQSTIHRGPVDLSLASDEIARRFAERLRELQPREIAVGVSLVGPHRDDLGFRIDGHDLGNFGSRGQQRTVALALKLAEVDHLQTRIGEPPILLLDDVFSELDPGRRERVLRTIQPGQQVLLTTTDQPSPTIAPSRSTWYRVANGKLEMVRDAGISPALVPG
jgi:DNA replication and repair protein RecF